MVFDVAVVAGVAAAAGVVIVVAVDVADPSR